MFWFSQMLKTDKKSFLTNYKFVFFFNWEILVKKIWENISWTQLKARNSSSPCQFPSNQCGDRILVLSWKMIYRHRIVSQKIFPVQLQNFWLYTILLMILQELLLNNREKGQAHHIVPRFLNLRIFFMIFFSTRYKFSIKLTI